MVEPQTSAAIYQSLNELQIEANKYRKGYEESIKAQEILKDARALDQQEMESLRNKINELENKIEVKNKDLADILQKNETDTIRIVELKENILFQREELRNLEEKHANSKEKLSKYQNMQTEVRNLVRKLQETNKPQTKCVFTTRSSERKQRRNELIDKIIALLESHTLDSATHSADFN